MEEKNLLKEQLNGYLGDYSDLDMLVEFVQKELDRAREEGIRYALSEVQERVGMQNEEVYVLCNAILQESLILTTK